MIDLRKVADIGAAPDCWSVVTAKRGHVFVIEAPEPVKDRVVAQQGFPVRLRPCRASVAGGDLGLPNYFVGAFPARLCRRQPIADFPQPGIGRTLALESVQLGWIEERGDVFRAPDGGDRGRHHGSDRGRLRFERCFSRPRAGRGQQEGEDKQASHWLEIAGPG